MFDQLLLIDSLVLCKVYGTLFVCFQAICKCCAVKCVYI